MTQATPRLDFLKNVIAKKQIICDTSIGMFVFHYHNKLICHQYPGNIQ